MTDNFGSGNDGRNFGAPQQPGQVPQQPGQMPPAQQPGQMPPAQQPGQMPAQAGQMPHQQQAGYQVGPQDSPAMNPHGAQENKKIVAGICALLVGGFGVHKFILGYNNEGIIQLVATMFTCGLAAIIPIIEGIIYLTKSDDEFYQTYQVGQKPWF